MLLSKKVFTDTRRFLILWLILGLVLLALGGAIGYFITHEYNRIGAVERDRLTTQAKVVDTNVERQLVALNLALIGVQSDLPRWKAHKDSKVLLSRYLQAMSDATPGVRTIILTDAGGTVSASNRKQLIGLNVQEREYFHAARHGLNPTTLYISPPFKTTLGIFSMNVVKVILDAHGTFAGIVSATLDPEFFSVLLNSVLYTPDMRASLVHGDGKIFVEVPDRKDLSGMDLAKPGSRFTLHVKSGQTANLFAAGRAYSTGDERMSAWRTIRPASLLMDKPLMVSVNRDMRGIFAPWRRGAFIQGGLFVVLFLASVFGLYLYQRRQQKNDCLAAGYAAELRESEERYRSLVELSPEAVVVHSEGKIAYINKSGVKIFGASNSGEMIGKSIKDFVHPSEWEKVQDRVRRVQEKNEPAPPQELVFNRLDGEAVYVETAGVPITLSGKIASLTIIHDITKRKRMEEEERRNREEAERLAKEMAILVEIGKVVGSTLDIEEVYESFAAEVQKLIPFDRLAVNLHRPDEEYIRVAYVFGEAISGRSKGELFPLKGSVSEVLIKTRAGLHSHPKNVEEMNQRFPYHAATVQAGMRSLMGVPLIYRDEVIASLHFRSKTPNAYTEWHLRLAERIGSQIAGAIGSAQLFSDLKKTENSLLDSERRFRGLVEQAAVGVAEIEMSTGRFFTVNRRLCEMVGRTEEELLATTFPAITHPDDLHLHEGKTQMMLAGDIHHYSLEKRYLRKDGGIVWVNITVSPLWKPGEAPGRNIAVVEDITDRKRMEEEILALSITDQLTGLHNRRGFLSLAEQQLKLSDRNKRGVQLYFADLDGLKWINDTLGHEEGDKALIEAATLFKETFRTSDIIARLGGDEYAALAVDTTEEYSEIFTARLQSLIDTRNNQENRRYRLSISVGCSYYDPENPCQLDELMAHADQLMYEQKQKKKGTLPQEASLSNSIH